MTLIQLESGATPSAETRSKTKIPKRRLFVRNILLGIDVAGLAVVLWAMRAGASVHRWWPVLPFLAVGIAAELHAIVIALLQRRRARAQRGGTVPQGVTLRAPLWMKWQDPFGSVRLMALLGAIVAATGFAGVAVGIVSTLFVLFAALWVFGLPGMGQCDGLTFEAEGLRVHQRDATFLVRWEAMNQVDGAKSDGFHRILVEVDDIRPALASLKPDTWKTRIWAGIVLGTMEGPRGTLTLVRWAAGLDETVLARALNAALGRRLPPVN